MQDRFKTRVWIEKYQKLVEVQNFGIDCGTCEWVWHDNIYPTFDGKPVLNDWDSLDERQEIIKKTKLCDCILMQCTGLLSFDGKLIYEGDILGGIFEAPIIYCEKCKGFALDFGGECSSCLGDVNWFDVVEENGKLEVLGNIYENEDLIE